MRERWGYLKRMPASPFPGTTSGTGTSPFPVEFPAPLELPSQYNFLFSFFVLRRAWFLLGSQQGWPSTQTFLFMELRLCVPGSRASRGPWLSCLDALASNEETKAADGDRLASHPEGLWATAERASRLLLNGAPFFPARLPNWNCQGSWKAGPGTSAEVLVPGRTRLAKRLKPNWLSQGAPASVSKGLQSEAA